MRPKMVNTPRPISSNIITKFEILSGGKQIGLVDGTRKSVVTSLVESLIGEYWRRLSWIVLSCKIRECWCVVELRWLISLNGIFFS